jgi:hypothetical protein
LILLGSTSLGCILLRQVWIRTHESRILEIVHLLLNSFSLIEVLIGESYLLLTFKGLELHANRLHSLNLISKVLGKVIVLTRDS